MSIPVRRRVRLVLTYLVLLIAAGWPLFPTLWMVSTSLKTPKEYFNSPPIWIPTQLTVEHYRALFTNLAGGVFFKHSIIVATGTTLVTLALTIPAAYAVARYHLGGERFTFWILSQRMVPPVATVIPLFLLYVRLHLLDTFVGLILAYCTFTIPLAVWLLMSFFADFPQEIQDQALVDGCSEFETLWRIIVPILAPGIVVVGLFCFVFSWNELMFAVTFTRDNTETVMKLFASLLQSPTSEMFGPAAAAVVMGMLPAYALTLFFQRYMVRGLTMGGVKQ